MATTVSTISKGTPISSALLLEHATAINDMHAEVFGRTSGVTISNDDNNTGSSFRVTEMQVHARKVKLSIPSTAANQPIVKTINFIPAFAAPPIVTATSVVGLDTDRVGLSASVSVSTISSTSANITVSFPQAVSSTVNLSVNVIALGIAPPPAK